MAENSVEIPEKKRKKSKKSKEKDKSSSSKKKKSSKQLVKELLSGVDLDQLKVKGNAAEFDLRRKLEEKLQKDPMLEPVGGGEIDEQDVRRRIERKLKRKREKGEEKKSKKSRSEKSRSSNGLKSVVGIASRPSQPRQSYRDDHDWRAEGYPEEKRQPPPKFDTRRHPGFGREWERPTQRRGWGGRAGPSRSTDIPVTTERGRRTYTGYDFHQQRRSRSPQEKTGRRPSPPRDMPEHIRWLHERWRKYDHSFFKDDQPRPAEPPSGMKAPTPGERINYNQQMTEFRKERAKQNRLRGSGANMEPLGGRQFNEEKPPPPPSEFAMPYYQFRKGGEYNANPGIMYTFKEYLLSLPKDVDDQEQAVQAYNDYKLEFRRKTLADFFQAHSEDEWFLERYHPMLKAKSERRRRTQISRRLDAFMQLLVRGYLEVGLDLSDSRRVRKLMDSVIVILEGGDEGDIACLSELDYMLEEKKEESYEVKQENDDDSSSDEDEKPMGKAPGQGRTREEQEADEEEGLPTAESLEVMQHAKDYTLYIQEHQNDGQLDVSDMPDMIESSAVKRQTEYMGSGVFVSRVINPKALEEMNLHKYSAILFRNVPPSATRAELEEICQDSHGGFLRLHLTEPDPNNQYFRQAIATFWFNANLTKILWKIRGTRIRGVAIVLIEYRDFKKKIARVDGLSADKSVVLRDIQLCKSLVEYLDRRYNLWGQQPRQEGETNEDETPPKANPLLINLDECLAYHLHQLMETGQEDPSKPKNVVVGKVDRDDNLTRVLDRLILYLRVVHSVDYYGCKLYETEEVEPRRIGTVTIRGEPSKSANPKRLAKYIKRFEERLKSLLPQERRLAEEHVELLGKRETEGEVEKFVQSNVISVVDGMSKCCLCFKRFTSVEFAHMHMKEVHNDKLEEFHVITMSDDDQKRICYQLLTEQILPQVNKEYRQRSLEAKFCCHLEPVNDRLQCVQPQVKSEKLVVHYLHKLSDDFSHDQETRVVIDNLKVERDKLKQKVTSLQKRRALLEAFIHNLADEVKLED